MDVLLTPDDLAPFVGNVAVEKLQPLIEEAAALAQVEAPCLATAELSAHHLVAVRGILRSAIVRYIKSGEQSNLQQQVVGPYSAGYQPQPMSRGAFFPSELKTLRTICEQITGSSRRAAFSIDTAPTPPAGTHQAICSLLTGDGTVCTCGAISLSAYPTAGLTG